MFQILLCDDEPSIINFLKTSIPWESLGIQNIYTASNGKEATDLFKEHQIDLLITDIQMPIMTGLELLEAVRVSNPDTHCILLTAYGEFEYAKAAFRLGVDNYLLKPIQLMELTDTIENTIENMYLHRQNKEDLFRENILRRWLGGNIGEDELGERSSLLGDINIYQSSYCAICMSKIDRTFSLPAYTEMCVQSLSRTYDCLNVWDNQGYYVLIISGHNINRQAVADVLKAVALQLDIIDKLCIAIGVTADQSENLPLSYQGAIKLLPDITNNFGDFIHLVAESASFQARIGISIDYNTLSPIIQKAIDYVHSEYPDSVSIKEFCVKHTITTSYLGYLFKKETNMFFNNYVNIYRLEKAIDLLKTTPERINAIAEMNGFTSTSYFISSFRKYTGMSPQKYREQNQ